MYMCAQSLNHVPHFATPWTIAHQAPLSMRGVQYSQQEFWNGLPFPSPGHLLDPGIELASPSLAGGFFTTEPPGKPSYTYQQLLIGYICAYF